MIRISKTFNPCLGLMKISELLDAFQDTSISTISYTSVVLPLLQKFDLAITWDNQHLIFPSLLPVQLSLNTIVDIIIFINVSRVSLLFHFSQVVVVHQLFLQQAWLNSKEFPTNMNI